MNVEFRIKGRARVGGFWEHGAEKIFGPEKEEIAERLRKLYTEEGIICIQVTE
jgi:hypothetical protein